MKTTGTTTSPLQNVLDRLNNPKQNGGRYTATCPAHEDRAASLSISEGEDGRVLLKCFAGCDTKDVVAALGLKMADLFTKGGRGVYHPPKQAQPRNRNVRTAKIRGKR